MHLSRLLMAILLLAGGTVPLAAQESKTTQNSVVSSLDKNVDPCVDFYQFACGGWIKNNPIPADRPIWSRFGELAERNRTWTPEDEKAFKERTQCIVDEYDQFVGQCALDQMPVSASSVPACRDANL
jgi:endothelin-converting enzyme/putative endopeptidase